MALFTRRDRIAIACIAVMILVGWILRLAVHHFDKPDELRIIRNAVKPPAVLESFDAHINVPLDINTADEKKLETLPMIGPIKAAAVLAYRREYGPFEKTSDIMNVRGIGTVTYEKIKDFITVKQDNRKEKSCM